MPRHLMDMGELGDRIGAAVRYTFSPSFSVQLSFDYNKFNNNFDPDRFWTEPLRRREQ